MNEDVSELQDLFTGAVQGITRHFVISEGTISDVNEDAQTCEVSISGAVFHDVPIKVLSNPDGADGFTPASVREKPQIGSWCLLGFRDGNLQRPQLISVDKSTDFNVDSPQVTFHGGLLDGMVKVIELTTKLNNIENLLNQFIQTYNVHTHQVTAVGQPTSPTTGQEEGSLTPTTQAEIENPKIKQ